MVNYTFEELADIHFMYGKSNGNSYEARRLYEDAFPDRQLPCANTFLSVHRRLRETGKLTGNFVDCGAPRTAQTVENEENVLIAVEQNPRNSTRRLANELGNTNHVNVWRIIHEQQLYPYHLQRVQALSEADFPARLQYCHWLRERNAEDRQFISFILFTDEASFTRNGIFNFHNEHYYADENPHINHQSRHQQQFSINVWAGIVQNYLVGPFILPRRLNGQTYLHFLQENLPNLIEDVPLNIRQRLLFMHDGAPAHFSHMVRDYLNVTFQGNWIGRGGPIPWPPRSPDLNPCDFYLWGHLKQQVYSTPIANEATLVERVTNACETIRQRPQIFRRVRRNMRRRLRACIEAQGNHFQHLM